MINNYIIKSSIKYKCMFIHWILYSVFNFNILKKTDSPQTKLVWPIDPKCITCQWPATTWRRTVMMESWLKRSSNAAENTEKQVNKKAKPEPTKYQQYMEDYVLMGFTSTSCNPPKALCFFCGEKLANTSMKPAHLQWHLTTKHGCHVGKPPDLFKRKLSHFKSSQDNMRKASTTSAKALEASSAVCLLVAKAKKTFTIAEDLLLPAAVVLAKTMLDKKNQRIH